MQIAESLLQRIESGELSPGDRLPPERALSQMLGVNRMTLRQALRLLELQGLLERRQGRGTTVALPKFDRNAGRLFSFTRGMERQGLRPGARLLSVEQRPVAAGMARDLSVPVSSMVYVITRLRTVNQVPALLERYTLPGQRFPGLDRHDLQARSVFEVLATEYGVAIERAWQSLEPVLASAYEAGLLQVDVGAPLMLERRVSYDAEGRPVEAGRDLYRGDRFRFITETAPREG
jgi:GntR family transcriptional regulator